LQKRNTDSHSNKAIFTTQSFEYLEAAVPELTLIVQPSSVRLANIQVCTASSIHEGGSA
jgi:hypothetical protein